jgi:hypothetical protein
MAVTPTQQGQLQRYAQTTTHDIRAALRAPAHSPCRQATLHALLNGVPSASIGKILTRRRRRAEGIYFSGSTWAQELATYVPLDATQIFDPSCGIGDLLVAAARRMQLAATLQGTLQRWCSLFRGMDLHRPFVEIAWNRLRALAAERHGSVVDEGRVPGRQGWIVGNAVREPWRVAPGSCLVMNPPFHPMPSPAWSIFSTGRVTAALPFLERALTQSPAGVTVVALVPEVLRSGSRFQKFRKWLYSHCEVTVFAPRGAFGGDADIDVAMLVARIRTSEENALADGNPLEAAGATAKTIGDLCRVHVGSVVPHRTPESGVGRPYITVADVAPGVRVEPTRIRHFESSAHRPHFVTVHRTSSPSDKQRVRATLIKGNTPVLVENHLLVLLPIEPTLAACETILQALQKPTVTPWLNERIRCRHLTVSSVAQIPLS